MSEFDYLGVWSVSGFVIISLVAQVFYLISLYKTLSAVPERYHAFPKWFVWMMIIPVIGYVFAWIMEPFGVPKTLEAYAKDQFEMLRDANQLFILGLSHMILITVSFIPLVGTLFFLAALVIWIVYWVKVVSFRKIYLTWDNNRD